MADDRETLAAAGRQPDTRRQRQGELGHACSRYRGFRQAIQALIQAMRACARSRSRNPSPPGPGRAHRRVRLSGRPRGTSMGSPTAITTFANGFGIMNRSQRSSVHARLAAQTIGITGALPMRATSTVPGFTSNPGPSGPSGLVTIDTPSFMSPIESRNTSAPGVVGGAANDLTTPGFGRSMPEPRHRPMPRSGKLL